MKRLTYRNENGEAKLKSYSGVIFDAYERLAAYEDTGLEPEAMTAINDVMKRYIDAEAEGRLLVLPCKVGDTVWSSVLCRIGDDGKEHPAPWPFLISMMDEWGTGFFLTRAEAEAALAKETDA